MRKKTFLFTFIILSLYFLICSSSNAEWTSITPPNVSPNWYLNGVHFTSSNEGWAVGGENQKGFLLHYLNGSWIPVTPPNVSSRWRLYGVHFTSSNEGWAVGGNYSDSYPFKGALLHYSNGSWTSVTPPNLSSNYDLNGVHFTSPNEGWAVGGINNIGVLLRYLNGFWTSVTPPNVSLNWYLWSVHFTSSDEGWAVGEDLSNNRGVLLHYSNGFWSSVSPPGVSSGWYHRSVHFTSFSEGWAVGFDSPNGRGVLLHYVEQMPSCPSIYFWDGNEYIRRGSIFPGAFFQENEYRDHIPLSQLVPNDGKYTLQIRETEPEKSFIDMAYLIVIDRSSNKNGNVLPNREPMAESQDCEFIAKALDENRVGSGGSIIRQVVLSPSSVTHSVLGDVRRELLYPDNRYVQMDPGEIVTLTFPYFPELGPQRDFIFVVEGFYVPQ